MTRLFLLLMILAPLSAGALAHSSDFTLDIKQSGTSFFLHITPPADFTKASFSEGDTVICSDATPSDGLTCDVTEILNDRKSHDFIGSAAALDGAEQSAVLTAQLTASDTLHFKSTSDCVIDNLKTGVFPKRIVLSGSCFSRASILLTIQSDPIVKSATADADGKFTVTVTEKLSAGLHTITGTFDGEEVKGSVPETAFCVGTRDECEALGYDGSFVVEEPGKLANRIYAFILVTAILLASALIMLTKRTRIGA